MNRFPGLRCSLGSGCDQKEETGWEKSCVSEPRSAGKKTQSVTQSATACSTCGSRASIVMEAPSSDLRSFCRKHNQQPVTTNRSPHRKLRLQTHVRDADEISLAV